jgi:hypothetical protein
MPAMAVMPTGAADTVRPVQTMDHGRHAAELGSDHPAPGKPCPHHPGMAHVAFCAACLTLPATVLIDLSPGFLFSYPAPGRARPLASVTALPLLPPPRG